MDFEIRSIFDLSTYDNQAVEEINDVFNRKKDLIAMLAYDNNEQHDNHNSPSKSSSLRGTQSPTRNNSGIIIIMYQINSHSLPHIFSHKRLYNHHHHHHSF